jgi:hypothetical protein
MRLITTIFLLVVLAATPEVFAQAPVVSSSASAAADGKQGLPADLPLRRDSDEDSVVPAGYGPWLVVLALALGGLCLVWKARGGKSAWLSRLRAANASTGPRVVAVKVLGAHTSLQVVEWNGKEMLLGCSPQGVNLLDSRLVSAAASPSDQCTPRAREVRP